jgi:hypothetical protein
MTKAAPKRPPPRTNVSPAKKPIGRWAGYAAAASFVILIVAVMLNSPEEVPLGIPDGTEVVPISDYNHVDGAVFYDRIVPAGGDHNPVWLQCGIYDQPVPTENAVHTLEHGGVWITYQPDIGSGAIGALEDSAGIRVKTILSPVLDQPSPVMATAWGRQLELPDANDIRLRQFIQHFESASTAREPGATCNGGVGAPTG